MIKFTYLFPICLLLSSCASFKQQKKQNHEEQYRSTEHRRLQESGRKKERQSLLMRDSLHEDMVMEVYPNGYFEFTVNEGFKGHASALKLVRRINKVHDQTQEKQADSLYRHSVNTAATRKETEKRSASQRFTWQWNLGYAAVAMVLFLAWWRYKRE